MPVDIQISADPAKREYGAAEALRAIFRDAIPESVDGKILIFTNAHLFGHKTRELDLVVLGQFPNGFVLRLPKYRRLVKVLDFCFTIEVKEHGIESLSLRGPNLCVNYNGVPKDVTNQSKDQMQSLHDYFKDRLGFSPYVCNLIWLRNVSRENLIELKSRNEKTKQNHNWLPASFRIEWLFSLATIQNKMEIGSDGCFEYTATGYRRNWLLNQYEEIFALFEKARANIGNLTRQKVEYITKSILSDQKYAQAIGHKLVVVAGRSGTGKTVKILRLAYDLAVNKGRRCLILTHLTQASSWLSASEVVGRHLPVRLDRVGLSWQSG